MLGEGNLTKVKQILVCFVCLVGVGKGMGGVGAGDKFYKERVGKR